MVKDGPFLRQLHCVWGWDVAQGRANFEMKNETKKTTEAQLLDLLKKVLPKATHDAQLAGKIYQAIEIELKAKARGAAFDKFCAKVELPDLEPKSLEEVKTQLAASFGESDVFLKPNRKEKTLAVEISLPDGTQFSGEINVNQNVGVDASEEQEITLKFVPFPVCLPGDKELVWLLGKRENLSPEEAGIALTKAETEFWASKTGQKLLRDRVERSFPEFIARVPVGMLNELGLKRHYKTPEPIKSLRAGKRN
jgi:Na+-translocating ferredoxin:NAD+ oxidoreductase RnfG subunit